jgi:hypothetical protein
MNKAVVAALIALGLAGCESEPIAPPPLPSIPSFPGQPPAFHPRDFAWSTQPGSAAIQGQVAYAPNRARYSCAGQPVVLTPDTPYSRWRIEQLYGSAERAALPVAEVRSRQAGRPSEDYSSFARRATCDAQGRFAFAGLPPGGWFIIVAVQPAAHGAEPVALMHHVRTQAGGTRMVVIG